MNTLANINELARAIRNMIRTGVIVETDLNVGRCRVQTGGNITDWLQWLTQRAGHSRTWWAPSIGEQVLILAVGGELDTALVLPGIFSDDHPAPSASADTLHIAFPDGAVIEYEPATSALTVSGIKTADVTASESLTATVPVVLVKASSRITLDTPEVVCTNRGGAERRHDEREYLAQWRRVVVQRQSASHPSAPRRQRRHNRSAPVTVNYTGMSRVNGRTLTDSQHVSQSMGDILRTPVGSRVMRREYGSLLSTLIDQPQTPALTLQVRVACYMALLKWEPRITLSEITTEQTEGRMTVNVTGQLVSTGETLSLTLPVS